MIFAEIGHTKFLLNNIEAATELMSVLAQAKQISELYVGDTHERITCLNPNQTLVDISIRNDMDILSYEDAMELKESKKVR